EQGGLDQAALVRGPRLLPHERDSAVQHVLVTHIPPRRASRAAPPRATSRDPPPTPWRSPGRPTVSGGSPRGPPARRDRAHRAARAWARRAPPPTQTDGWRARSAPAPAPPPRSGTTRAEGGPRFRLRRLRAAPPGSSPLLLARSLRPAQRDLGQQ